MERKWWKEAFGYQIYPRSFYDANQDGVGDIRGIINKLDYLETLGINLIWICPFYKSPMDDNGYDVSDYYDIDPLFGNLDDCKELIETAHKKGIKIVADLVLNHTSDEHPWFVEAKKSKDNQYRDYYIWQEGKNGKEPNNWASFFGGSAWKKDEETDEYFMKIFSDKMPDLNWENSELRQEMYKMANWWLELGIDGFRVDAVAHIARDTSFVDSELELNNGYAQDWSKFSNLPGVHTHLQEFHQEVLKGKDVMTVGEVGGDATIPQALEYVGKERHEFNMVFNFDHNHCYNHLDDKPYNEVKLDDLKEVFNKWQTGLYGKAWNALYWLNHDQPRVLSQYGNTSEEYRNVSAKMLATAMYFMWGTPFLYNGEEIGMSNYPFTKLSEFNDVAIHTNYKYAKEQGLTEAEYVKDNAHRTRDNARSLMQWSSNENAGFGKKLESTILNPNYKQVNVESQLGQKDSVLSYYQKVISLRTKSEYKDVICYGDYTQVMTDIDDVYAYIRKLEDKEILVVTNFGFENFTIDFDYEVKNLILSNYDDIQTEAQELRLRAYEGFVIEL